jgi:UDP-apiose/xylose synthase
LISDNAFFGKNTSIEKKITVLGCGGFIGSHIIRYLISSTDYFVVGIDRDSTRIEKVLDHPRFSFKKGDLYSDPETLRKCIAGSSVVISLAALCNPSLYTSIPIEVIESNFVKPYHLLEMCTEARCWLLHFSTCEVYGKSTDALHVNDSYTQQSSPDVFNELTTQMIVGPVHAQRWCYAVAKQLYERAMYAWGTERGLSYTIIRPFNFIGPEMDYLPGIDGEGIPRVLACFMNSLLSKKPLMLVDGGVSRRSFTYINDAVEAVAAILQHPDQSRNQIFNIGNPENEISIRDLALKMITLYKELSGECGQENMYTTENVSSRQFYGEGYEDCDRRIPDINHAIRQLGWQPQTNLDNALRKTIKAYIKKYKCQ